MAGHYRGREPLHRRQGFRSIKWGEQYRNFYDKGITNAQNYHKRAEVGVHSKKSRFEGDIPYCKSGYGWLIAAHLNGEISLNRLERITKMNLPNRYI